MIHYIINLERSKDRRENIAKTFVQQGLVATPNFWPAVDGSQLSNQEKKRLCINPYLHNAELGCAASHLAIYRDMLAKQYHSAFIFEDDIAVAPEVTHELLLHIQNFFDTLSHPAILQLRWVKNLGKRVATIDNIHIYEAFHSWGTFAYLINQKAAQAVLDHNVPIRFEADLWKMYKQSGLMEIYCLGKDLFFPNDLANETTITTNLQRANKIPEHKKLIKDFKRNHGFTSWHIFLYWLQTYYYRYIVHGKDKGKQK